MKVEESDKVNNKESDPETNQEESGSVLFVENDISKNADNETVAESNPEVSEAAFPCPAHCTGNGDQSTTEEGLSSNVLRQKTRSQTREEKTNDTIGAFLMTKGRSECFEIVESRKDVRENDKEKV